MKLALQDFDIVVFDLDGTIYNSNTLIEGADEIVNYFRKENKKIIFGTNNSGKSRKEISDKLNKMGVTCLGEEEVVTSAYLARQYVQEHNLKDIFVIGTDQLKEEVRLGGGTIVDEDKAKALLVGFVKDINYKTLSIGFRLAKKLDTVLFCNEDRFYPASDGLMYPGCGYITGSIKWCANLDNYFNIGKPSTYMLDYISSHFGIKKERILCIGDSEETDYPMAHNSNVKCILINNPFKANDVINVKDIKEISKLF